MAWPGSSIVIIPLLPVPLFSFEIALHSLKNFRARKSLNAIFPILDFSRSDGIKIYSNHKPEHTDLDERFSPIEYLEPIFQNLTDTLFLEVRQARFEDGYRYGIALASENNSAIVVNLDAEELLNFRRKIGFGALLKSVTRNEGITFAILQDSIGIIIVFEDLAAIQGQTKNLYPYLEY